MRRDARQTAWQLYIERIKRDAEKLPPGYADEVIGAIRAAAVDIAQLLQQTYDTLWHQLTRIVEGRATPSWANAIPDACRHLPSPAGWAANLRDVGAQSLPSLLLPEVDAMTSGVPSAWWCQQLYGDHHAITTVQFWSDALERLKQLATGAPNMVVEQYSDRLLPTHPAAIALDEIALEGLDATTTSPQHRMRIALVHNLLSMLMEWCLDCRRNAIVPRCVGANGTSDTGGFLLQLQSSARWRDGWLWASDGGARYYLEEAISQVAGAEDCPRVYSIYLRRSTARPGPLPVASHSAWMQQLPRRPWLAVDVALWAPFVEQVLRYITILPQPWISDCDEASQPLLDIALEQYIPIAADVFADIAYSALQWQWQQYSDADSLQGASPLLLWLGLRLVTE